jgi:hypothetical protein
MAAEFENIFPSTTENLLYALLRSSTLRRPKEFAEHDVTNTASGLSIPTGVRSAWLVLETDGNETNPAKACRFRLDGEDPTTSEGLPLGDGGNIRLENPDQLSGFNIIAVDGAATHKLSIQFFD